MRSTNIQRVIFSLAGQLPRPTTVHISPWQLDEFTDSQKCPNVKEYHTFWEYSVHDERDLVRINQTIPGSWQTIGDIVGSREAAKMSIPLLEQDVELVLTNMNLGWRLVHY
jgi:hypothetical protein